MNWGGGGKKFRGKFGGGGSIFRGKFGGWANFRGKIPRF